MLARILKGTSRTGISDFCVVGRGPEIGELEKLSSSWFINGVFFGQSWKNAVIGKVDLEPRHALAPRHFEAAIGCAERAASCCRDIGAGWAQSALDGRVR